MLTYVTDWDRSITADLFRLRQDAEEHGLSVAQKLRLMLLEDVTREVEEELCIEDASHVVAAQAARALAREVRAAYTETGCTWTWEKSLMRFKFNELDGVIEASRTARRYDCHLLYDGDADIFQLGFVHRDGRTSREPLPAGRDLCDSIHKGCAALREKYGPSLRVPHPSD